MHLSSTGDNLRNYHWVSKSQIKLTNTFTSIGMSQENVRIDE